MPSAINFPESNDVLLCGDNPNCNDLQIWRGKETLPPVANVAPDGSITHDGIIIPIIISKWKFTPEEMAELIKNNGEFWVESRSITHPPIYVNAFKRNFPNNGVKEAYSH